MAKIYAPQKTITTEYDDFAGNINNLGYQKIANTIEQFSVKPAYDNNNVFWVTTDNVNGTIGYDADQSARTMTITGGETAKLCTQTKQSFVYLSGNVHRFTSGVHCDLQVGAYIEFGIGDVNNGAFIQIERTATKHELRVIRRSKATGVVTEEVINQADFNLDKLDGTGDSGINIDLTKIQMWHIEFSWYGAGGIVFGAEIDRRRVFFHWFSAGNRLSYPIFGDPDLPIRHCIVNKQATAGNSTLYLHGIFLGVDGSFDQRKGFNRAYVRPLRNVSVNTNYALASIRPATTYKGKINRAYARLEDFFVFGTADGTYELQFLTNLTAGASWQSVDVNNSMMQFEQSATAFTDGVILYGGAISSQNASDKKEVLTSKDPLTAFSDGSGTSNLTIVFRCTSAGNIGCGFNWSEYY